MIRGYCAYPSVRRGEPLVLHVSTDAPRFRAVFFRCAEHLVRMGESGTLTGKRVEPGAPELKMMAPAAPASSAFSALTAKAQLPRCISAMSPGVKPAKSASASARASGAFA